MGAEELGYRKSDRTYKTKASEGITLLCKKEQKLHSYALHVTKLLLVRNIMHYSLFLR